mmetsp:Transcript_58887/g.65876  ORF Transcript_58887/g.65876 Transcript_58887/m.65876 type:complete len:615 (+) Transcript_58887:43-1887(+)
MSTKKKANDDDEDDPLMVTASTAPDKSDEQKGEEDQYQESYAQAQAQATEVEVDGLPNQEVSLGCGILGRYPILSLLCFVLVGVCIGIGLSYWRPTTADGITSKAVALKWINLVGDMFLRMLKCIVLPIVFVNVIIAVVDMMQVGKAGGVGGTTVIIYISTTLIAGILAVIFSVMFKGLYLAQDDDEAVTPAYITLGCASSMDGETQQANSYLREYPNGTLACSADYESQNDVLWTIQDVNGTFVQNSAGAEVADLSLSDTIYSGVFETLIPANIFAEFVDSNFTAVIVFAIAMGVAAAQVLDRQQLHSSDMTFMALLVELDQMLTVIINWILLLTPFAVLSLVTAALGGESDLGALFKNMGLLIACILLCYLTHFLLTYCGGYYVLTRRNPFTYMSHLGPAQIMAFASSSSAATIPLSTECVQSTKQVPDSILRFVIPLGATVNMDGACIQVVCSCVWLAVYNGVQVNAANFILLIIISTFGSMGTAPVPNATLALIVTSYHTVFGGEHDPDGFAYLMAIDWFMDRCSTMLNVTGDMTVCGVIGARIQMEAGGVRGSVRHAQHVHGSLYDLASQPHGLDSIRSRMPDHSGGFHKSSHLMAAAASKKNEEEATA